MSLLTADETPCGVHLRLCAPGAPCAARAEPVALRVSGVERAPLGGDPVIRHDGARFMLHPPNCGPDRAILIANPTLDVASGALFGDVCGALIGVRLFRLAPRAAAGVGAWELLAAADLSEALRALGCDLVRPGAPAARFETAAI